MKGARKQVRLAVLSFILFAPLLFAAKTSAAAVPNTVKYKAAYEGVYQCFAGGAYKETFLISSYSKNTNGVFGAANMIKNPLGDDAVKLPYGLTNAADNNANCKQILGGFSDETNKSTDNLRAGLLQAGMFGEKDVVKLKDYLAGANNEGGDGSMGYKADEKSVVNEEEDASRAKITFTTNQETIANACFKEIDGQKVAGDPYIYDDQGNKVSEIVFPAVSKRPKEDNGWWSWIQNNITPDRWLVNTKSINVPMPGSGETITYYYCNGFSRIVIANKGGQENPYYDMGLFSLSVGDNGWEFAGTPNDLLNVSITTEKVTDTERYNDYNLTFGGNIMRAIAKLSTTSAAGYNLPIDKSKGYGALALSDAEIYALYTYYIKDVFGYPVVCEGDAEFSNYNDSNSKEIKWAKGKKCRIYTQVEKTPPSHKVYGINNNTKHFVREVGLDDVINGLNMLPDSVFDELDDAETGGTLGADSTTDGDAGGVDNRCFAAAASLGWIVCPVIQAVGDAVEGIYKNVVAPFLTIDAQYFSTSGDRKGIYDGWNAFREFANIVFVILFVIVILAQVTGIGISNYNIKKILPRLIVIVVLVNMSFIICQLAVDLSNILGYQLNNLFANQLASTITIDPINGEDVSYTLGGIVSVITTVLAGGAGYLAVVNWQLWIIPLLLALLSCGIGILFFFVILGVRQAGVIILAVLAPVAIVCYALPNTKSIFDKWRKLFTSLLVLYPLCGILMGGGAFASKLIIAVNGGKNFFYTLVAMLLTVVPFFFIPTLLKSSMAALGNIGTKLSNMGKSWSSAASRGVSGTDMVNDWRRQLEKRHNLSVANRLDRRLARRRSSNPNATLSAGAMRRLARSKVAYQGAVLDEGNNQFTAENMNSDSLQQALDAQKFEQEQKLINNAAQSIIGGNATYTDTAGITHDINASDLDSVGSNTSLMKAFKDLSAQYNRTGDRQTGIKMNAVAQVMANKYKDKGVSKIINELESNTNFAGNVVRTRSLNSVSQLMNRDEKLMGALKKGNYGAFEFLTDGANFTGDAANPSTFAAMRSQLDYQVPDSSHTTTADIPNLSDSLFDGYNNAISQGVFKVGGGNYNKTKADELIKLTDTIRRAVDDEKIAKDLNQSKLNDLNTLNFQAYQIERDRWLAANQTKTNMDYTRAVGAYKPLKLKS